MPRLPHTIDFNDLDFPELADVFHGIDAGIAAIVASDPAMSPKAVAARRPRARKSGTTPRRSRQVQRQAA